MKTFLTLFLIPVLAFAEIGSDGPPRPLTWVTLSGKPTTFVFSDVTYANPAWISSLAWSKITGAPTVDLSGYVPISRTVNSQPLSGNVVLTKSDLGLGNVDNTSDAAKPVSTAQAAANAVVASAAASDATTKANAAQAAAVQRGNHTGTQSADTLTDGTTNKAFLATERTKLAGVAPNATANSSDATLLARANHTGTQPQSTVTSLVTDLAAKVSSVSINTANGVSATNTGTATAPTLTISLGAITPSMVNGITLASTSTTSSITAPGVTVSGNSAVYFGQAAIGANAGGSMMVYGGGGVFLGQTNNTSAAVCRIETGVFGFGGTSQFLWSSTSDPASIKSVGFAKDTETSIKVVSGSAFSGLTDDGDVKARQHVTVSTITAAGTTGARTINKGAGTIRIAAGNQTVTLTNSLIVAATKFRSCQVQTDDTTAKSAVPSAISTGSATLKLNASATAEVEIYWELAN